MHRVFSTTQNIYQPEHILLAVGAVLILDAYLQYFSHPYRCFHFLNINYCCWFYHKRAEHSHNVHQEQSGIRLGQNWNSCLHSSTFDVLDVQKYCHNLAANKLQTYFSHQSLWCHQETLWGTIMHILNVKCYCGSVMPHLRQMCYRKW